MHEILYTPETSFKQENVENLSFPDKEFDVAAMTQVLEHVRNIHAAIEHAHRVCRDKPIIVVQCQRPCRYPPDLHIHWSTQ